MIVGSCFKSSIGGLTSSIMTIVLCSSVRSSPRTISEKVGDLRASAMLRGDELRAGCIRGDEAVNPDIE